MADWIIIAFAAWLVGLHMPAPAWATWFWNKVWAWMGRTPPPPAE